MNSVTPSHLQEEAPAVPIITVCTRRHGLFSWFFLLLLPQFLFHFDYETLNITLSHPARGVIASTYWVMTVYLSMYLPSFSGSWESLQKSSPFCLLAISILYSNCLHLWHLLLKKLYGDPAHRSWGHIFPGLPLQDGPLHLWAPTIPIYSRRI